MKNQEIKVGYSISSNHELTQPSNEYVKQILEHANTAHQCGYSYIQAGDHHALSDSSYLQNTPISGLLGSVFDNIATMFLLPLYHPVLVAEQAGTLSAMTERFDFWCALGFNDKSFQAFDIPKSERADIFEESLTIIKRLWEEERVTFEGEYYSLDKVSVSPSAQDARICIGGTAKPAIKRAAEMGDAWIISPSEPKENLQKKIEYYYSLGGKTVQIRRDALVLRHREDARELVKKHLNEGYRGWPSTADWMIQGDRNDALEELKYFQKLGIDELIIRPISDDAADETLQLISEAKQQL